MNISILTLWDDNHGNHKKMFYEIISILLRSFKFDSIATKSECVNDLLVTVFTNWETITAIQAISF